MRSHTLPRPHFQAIADRAAATAAHEAANARRLAETNKRVAERAAQFEQGEIPIESLGNRDLQVQLKRIGCPAGGSKAVLLDRLKAGLAKRALLATAAAAKPKPWLTAGPARSVFVAGGANASAAAESAHKTGTGASCKQAAVPQPATAEKEDTATAGAAGVTPADKEGQKAARGTLDGRLVAHDAKRRKLDESPAAASTQAPHTTRVAPVTPRPPSASSPAAGLSTTVAARPPPTVPCTPAAVGGPGHVRRHPTHHEVPTIPALSTAGKKGCGAGSRNGGKAAHVVKAKAATVPPAPRKTHDIRSFFGKK